MRRRDALVIGGAVATALAIPPVLRRLPSSFTFDPISGFDGFRRLSGGNTPGGINPFAGIDALHSSATAVEVPQDAAALCAALFGPEGWAENIVPVAIFTDANCPYCKTLEDRLLEMEAADMPIRLIWHEMPLLGQASVRAARAVRAAALLGKEREARAYLWHHVMPPGPVGLRRMAEALDLDADLLQSTVMSAQVSTALSQSLALGRRLGIPGTPGTFVGRTLAIGAIKKADLRALIALEQSEAQPVCT